MKTIIILGIILILIFSGAGVIIYFTGFGEQVACTEDARICPDGTAVVRIPPDCEFEECPDESNTIASCLDLGCFPGEIYVGSINSDKYYECKCGWAKTISPENIICFKDDAEAVADNRVKSEC